MTHRIVGQKIKLRVEENLRFKLGPQRNTTYMQRWARNYSHHAKEYSKAFTDRKGREIIFRKFKIVSEPSCGFAIQIHPHGSNL